MAATPDNTLGLAKEYLRVAFSKSDRWKTLCGATTEAKAKAHTYVDGPAPPDPADRSRRRTREEWEELRPLAIIYTAPDGFARSATGVAAWDCDLRLAAWIEVACDDVYRDEPGSEAMTRFDNDLGAIVDELCELTETAGCLAFDRVELVGDVEWFAKDRQETEGRWIAARLLFTAEGVQ